ncbi:MAG: glycosyltransferase family 2 protein [Sumerlaeia bacterium]
MAPRPDLSVVLINWRMAHDLAKVMPSIDAQERRCTIEVIVVNKPSGDGAEELVARYDWVRLISHPKFGIAEMRNVGIREARGRYCLMLDADTEVLPGCFDALVGFMDANRDVGACGANTRRPDGSIEYNVKRFYDLGTILVRRMPWHENWENNPWNHRHLMKDKDRSKPFAGDWVAGACFCMRRRAIEDVGLFDDRYKFGFEDTDWCWRARQAGWRIAFNPHARIIHKVQRMSAAGFNSLTVAHLRSGFLFWLKKTRMEWGLRDPSPRLGSWEAAG